MNVAIVGHTNDQFDEGVRIVTKLISYYLNKDDNINSIAVDINSFSSISKIFKFKPSIIHFVLTPTLSGLIIAKLISIINWRARTVISAVHPSIPKNSFLNLLRPDLTLVQSVQSEELFKYLGFETKFFPNGVDLCKFHSVDEEIKLKLRKSYGINSNKFILLHLASLTKERNLDIFTELQKKDDFQVLIIGRDHENYDKSVVADLEEAGCFVWIKHFSNIEEIYQLSDCYIFPTNNPKACIETPLSVLEAMACNLPVITTKFGALTRIFKESGGFFFVESDNYDKVIDKIRNFNETNTNEMVSHYSWEKLITELISIYKNLK